MREIIRLSTEWDAVVAALGPHAHPGLSPSESVAEVVAALEQAQAMYETSHASRVHADGCVLRLEAERDSLRLACNVFAADLTEAGRLCGIADDEYPLRAVERVAAERDALLRSEERHLDLIDKLESEREAAMSAWKKYRKTALQEMRPFVPGEDLTKISVNKEDVPEPGGMVARNAKNAEDQWYVARKFFEDNYELVKP
jgi:hypothetical protein